MNTPSLFDDEDATTPTAEAVVVVDAFTDAGLSQWCEVPQALFNSWSRGRQFDYCARRDVDAARFAENDEWRTFYLNRAMLYQMLVRAKGPNE